MYIYLRKGEIEHRLRFYLHNKIKVNDWSEAERVHKNLNRLTPALVRGGGPLAVEV